MGRKITVKVTGPSGRSIQRTTDLSLPVARKRLKKIFGKQIIVKQIKRRKKK